MTKKQLFKMLKDVPDDVEITINNSEDLFGVIKISFMEKVQIEVEEGHSTNKKNSYLSHIQKYCAEGEYFNAVVLS